MHTTRARPSVPEIGRWVPTATVHFLFLVAAVGLCLLVFESPLWLAIGLLLTVTGTLLPNVVPTWWLLAVLALSQFWREPMVTDLSFYLLLAGVHLRHVLGGLVRLLPWSGQMQVVAFARPFKRFVYVQAVVQVVAVSALFAFGGGRGAVKGLSIFTAVVLGLVAAGLARVVREEKSRA